MELDNILISHGCISYKKGVSIMGEVLLTKLQAIGMYDFNLVSNSNDSQTFITKPSAFSKYGNPFEEDAFDLAKAFVSSLYYGMTVSKSGRGRITSLRILLQSLINGHEVGPATAIGEDYKILELRRVIQIRRSTSHKDRYFMRLLKKDIGAIALEVLETGEALDHSILYPNIHPGSVTNYIGPEANREITRKKQMQQSDEHTANLLRTLRL